jgi:flagellum-specific peptidoglycan hydrolase FlgJ
MAQEEMRRFGIPASFKMAQAILESEGGTAASTAAYNNHFGRHLKGINFTDDQTNWRAHSLYLVENYPSLLTAGSNYMDWVRALEATDYSLEADYTRQLLGIIKAHKLYELDY